MFSRWRSSSITVMIGLQARGRHSVGEERTRLGRSAFHWSVVVVNNEPGATTWYRFDVTDGIVQDPITFKDLNPNENWVYRHLTTLSSTDIPRWLGGVLIGKLDLKSDLERAKEICEKVVLPEKDMRPSQNCLSWVVDAIGALQDAGLITRFEINPLLDFAVHHADQRIVDYENVSEVVHYPPCVPSKKSLLASISDRLRPRLPGI